MKKLGFVLFSISLFSVCFAQNWYTLGSAEISAGQVYYLSMALASDGTPYVGYTDVANSSKATVKKFDGANWVAVGTIGFSAGTAGHMNMTLSSNGIPYVVYQDGANSNKATVQKFNGSSWEVVGTAGFSAGSVTSISIAIHSDGSPYIGFADGANGGKPTAMCFNGSNWVTIGTAGFTNGMPSDLNFTLSNWGTPYFALRYSEPSGQKASVVYFDGVNWTNVGLIYEENTWIPLGMRGFSIGAAYYIKIKFPQTNNPYVVFSDGGNGSKVTVMMYDGITSWVNVGDVVSGFNCSTPSIAFATDGTPYVSYMDANKLVIKKFNGSNWVSVGADPITSGDIDYPLVAINSLGTPYTAFSDLSLAGKATMMRYTNNANDPLPVELASFTAAAKSYSVELKWQTATEVNSYGFEVEKTTGGSQPAKGSPSPNTWVKIGFVQGNGNSNSPKEYSFIEANPVSGKSYYRLKMIDIDGSFEYSKEVEVNTKLPSQFALHQNYPNPFNPTTMIEYSIPETGHAPSLQTTLKVYDVLGKEIVTLVDEAKEAGSYKVKFDASKLSTGVYFYNLRAGTFFSTQKLIIQK
jgi:hypothetical protein